MDGFWSAVGALVPPVGVGLIFWLVIRWIVQADRRERLAIARMERADRGGAAAPDAPAERPGPGTAAGDPPVERTMNDDT